MKQLAGIIPALFTPFSSDGSVNYGSLKQLVRFQLQARVNGFYITGSSGEWVKLSLDERKRIAETVLSEVSKEAPVVVHVGHHHTDRAVELCEHAASLGADMVSAVIPGFYDYKVREVSQYYRSIARVGLPVIVYYLGGSSRVFTAQDFVEEMGSIEGIVGLKYTATDLFTMQTIQELSGGRLSVWCGQDQMALPALLMNATGVIGSSYNYIPELFVALYGAYREGDIRLARDLQFEANCISYAVKKYGNIPAYKAVLELRGLDVGDCRPPLLPLRTEEREKLKTVTARYAQWLGEIELKDKLSPVTTS